MRKTCLNCRSELGGKYCSVCGQKSATQRITFARFIEHDLVHGLMHLDRGVIYTAKTLLFDPGRTAREYLNGKRVRHYSIFALFIIVIALKVYIDNVSGYDLIFRSNTFSPADDIANKTLDYYYKLLYFLCIPILAILTLVLFRKPQLNYPEHLVTNCFLVTAGYLYSTLLSVTNIAIDSPYLTLVGIVAMAIVYLWGLRKFMAPEYSFFEWLWRALLLLILAVLVFGVTIALFINFYWGKFQGSVNFQVS